MKKKSKEICVCILAHNEEKHIRNTIYSILRGNDDIYFDIVVYANGCIDNTIKIVKELASSEANIHLRELEIASKPAAWNVAIKENKHLILIFSDGDVTPEPGTVTTLYHLLRRRNDISLVGCQFWPQKLNLSLTQRLSGFLQIPLAQDFLSGQFYAIRRCDLFKEFQKTGIEKLPGGIVAEDAFLEALFPTQKFFISPKKIFYEPPTFDDYLKYLARVRWQNEQLKVLYHHSSLKGKIGNGNLLQTTIRKFRMTTGVRRILLGIISTSFRYLFKKIFSKKIERYYLKLGAVSDEGHKILSTLSRSESTK